MVSGECIQANPIHKYIQNNGHHQHHHHYSLNISEFVLLYNLILH